MVSTVDTRSLHGRGVFWGSFDEESYLNSSSTHSRIHPGLSDPQGGIPSALPRINTYRITLRFLEHFPQHEGRLVPRLELLQAVWGLGYRFR